jgi:hypothetical protein
MSDTYKNDVGSDAQLSDDARRRIAEAVKAYDNAVAEEEAKSGNAPGMPDPGTDHGDVPSG